MTLLTTSQLAQTLGVSERRARAIAQARGIKPKFAVKPQLWNAADVERLRPGKPGRPVTQPARRGRARRG